ncbi:MAG: translation initiation factor [Chitinophagaceae bacterium]
MPKKHADNNGIVFSTDPSFQFTDNEASAETLIPANQKLIIKLETKHRAGKTVTSVNGFIGKQEDLQFLEKKLKNFCGTGGSSKDGIILIQGDQRKKIVSWLTTNGYSKTKQK